MGFPKQFLHEEIHAILVVSGILFWILGATFVGFFLVYSDDLIKYQVNCLIQKETNHGHFHRTGTSETEVHQRQ